MADLTGVFNATGITKGQDNEITLSKVNLESTIAGIGSGDLYFEDQANWKQVKAVYLTDEGKQVNELIFDASLASPLGNFNPSSLARDTWEIKAIIIFDFDGGFLKINRGDLTASEFDIVFGAAISVNYSSTLKDPNITLSNGDLDAVTSDTSGFGSGAFHESSFAYGSGKYYTEVTRVAGGIASSVQLAFKVFDTVPTLFGLSGLGNPVYPSIAGQETSVNIWMTHSAVAYTVGTGNQVGTSVTPGPIVNGDVIGIAIDLDNDLLYVHVNGVWQGAAGNPANPSTGTNGQDISIATGLFNGAVNMNNCYFDTCHLLGGASEKTTTPLYLPTGFTNI